MKKQRFCRRRRLGFVLVVMLLGLAIWRNSRTPPLLVASSQQQSPTAQFPRILAKGDMLHLIKTRFMQHQAPLQHLTRARLVLFQAFCLPSMIHQTAASFVWIVSVDPNVTVLDQLVQLLRPHPHFYLTLTTDNNKPGSGRHGINADQLLTGDAAVLRANLDQLEDLTVLETQLDADDALHVNFVATVQQLARHALSEGREWMYACIARDLEWHWTDDDNSHEGRLAPSRSFVDKQKCYTPGMSLGVKHHGESTSHTPVLAVPHSALYATLQTEQTDCGPHHSGLDCLQFIDQLDYPALRTRTPTSASMVGVQVAGPAKQSSDDSWWSVVTTSFAVQRPAVRQAHRYLSHHMPKILQDALAGQCSHGHSCRPQAKEALELLSRAHQNQSLR